MENGSKVETGTVPTHAPQWTDEQKREGLRILFRHLKGAPTSHFGDTRERSQYIRGMVHRVQYVSRLKLELGAAVYLGENMTLTREEKTKLFEVSHALRGEIRARQDGGE